MTPPVGVSRAARWARKWNGAAWHAEVRPWPAASRPVVRSWCGRPLPTSRERGPVVVAAKAPGVEGLVCSSCLASLRAERERVHQEAVAALEARRVQPSRAPWQSVRAG